jgi:hypothetical protein
MTIAAKRSIVFLVVVCFLSCCVPVRGAVTMGAPTADAAVSSMGTTSQPATQGTTLADAVHSGVPVLTLGALAAYADPDTTEFEFPEDENKHLVRDITVWAIAAAFVGFFIIKVFIEEDEETPTDDSPPGKQI